ncbi:MAG: cytochrome c oxidase subunit II [Desulfuromonas sp.]|nr:cytochrome c oxidase subunit II [Desulfuromonas sp.]
MQPLQTTTEAVDTAFYVILGIDLVMLLGIMTAMIWFVWRYNRKRQPLPLSQKDKNLWLEITWTVIPTLLVMLMFWYGWEGYLSLRRIPDDAMHIKASARMWSWLFTYDNGKTAGKLYVPVGRPVKVELHAEDVLHSFYVPAFRVKRDTVPGMTNWVWFEAEKPGSYDLFCAEYCGVGHSSMVTTVEALSAAEFQAWLTGTEEAADRTADRGEELARQQGCLGCHSTDGSRKVGPSFKGLFGETTTVTRDGQQVTVTADAAYLARSIREPAAEVVVGYPPVMPPFTGLSEADLQALIGWLRSLQ